MKIAIVGGTGDFGKWYAQFFSSIGWDVTIMGRSESGRQVAEQLNVDFQIFPSKITADYIMVSVPPNVVKNVLTQLKTLCNNDTLIFDVCSVKKEVCETLSSINNKEIASIHPMHGPRISSLEGVSVVFIPLKTGEKYNLLKNIFKSAGSDVIESTPEEHDKVISIVQGLTHFSSVVSAGVIHDLNVDFLRTLDFKSPNYELFSTLLTRILIQNPALYSEIQFENPENQIMRQYFVSIAKNLSNSSKEEYQKNMETFSKAIKKSEKILNISDKAIQSIKQEKRTLLSFLNKKILLKGFDGKFHYGKLLSVEKDELLLQENEKKIVLNMNNFTIPDKKSEMEWKKENVGIKSRDFSFLVPMEVNKELLICAFSQKVDSNIEIVDEFKNEKLPEGKKSITLRVKSFEDETKAVEQTILSSIAEFGFVLR